MWRIYWQKVSIKMLLFEIPAELLSRASLQENTLWFLHSLQDHQAQLHLCDDLDHISYFQLQLIFVLRDVAELGFAPPLADLLPWRAEGEEGNNRVHFFKILFSCSESCLSSITCRFVAEVLGRITIWSSNAICDSFLGSNKVYV